VLERGMIFLLALREIDWNTLRNEKYHDGSLV
jgi:hypothetical protein